MIKTCLLTCGEPAGTAGELVSKAWEAQVSPFFVVGPPTLYAQWGAPVYPMRTIDEPIDGIFKTHLPCFPLDLPFPVTPGVIDIRNSAVAIKALQLACAFVRQNAHTHALVTLPIDKKAFYEAGFTFSGHTEFLAAQAGLGEDDVAMMLSIHNLHTVPLTNHVPLRLVPNLITFERLVCKALVIHRAFPKSRIAVAGLNPHAGERGALGDEEERVIQPGIQYLRDRGVPIYGPYSADTLFADSIRSTYDIALCMYHDQALIPIKTIDFYGGINQTIGLPFTRTSPDHGPALNISGQGIAHIGSLCAAIAQAAKG